VAIGESLEANGQVACDLLVAPQRRWAGDELAVQDLVAQVPLLGRIGNPPDVLAQETLALLSRRLWASRDAA
jgi:hypothetical protein